jgi:pimeloyl-ACP methyl ester carboxylesterase
MASERPERIAGIVANDTGTETSSKSGKKMIAAADADAYTFDAAVDKLRTATAHNFPDFGEQDWRNYARQVYTGVGDGKYVRNFDALFLEELARFKLEKESFWDEFVSLRNLPIALLRGVNSDYFTSDQARKMAAAQPLAELVEVGGRGHPLLLDEPQSLASIRKLLTMADQGGNKASAN